MIAHEKTLSNSASVLANQTKVSTTEPLDVEIRSWGFMQRHSTKSWARCGS
jgi:hypothetical protein